MPIFYCKATSNTINDKSFEKALEDILFGETPRGRTIAQMETNNPFGIQSILANHKKKAFTVVWEDGTSTVIHLQEGDVWDNEKALAMCFVKKLKGNKGSFNDIFTQELPAKIKTISAEKNDTKDVNVKDENVDSALTKAIDDLQTVSKTVTDKIAQATAKTSNASELSEKINELCANTKKENHCHKYHVYHYNSLSKKSELIYSANDVESVRKFISGDAKKRGHGLYFRYWPSDDSQKNTFVDYGSYSFYYHVTGIGYRELAGR